MADRTQTEVLGAGDIDPAPVHAPVLGEPGEPCLVCGSPLAADQRYCLECGTRRGEPRVAFLDLIGPRTPSPPWPPPPAGFAAGGRPGLPPLGWALLAGALGLVFCLGVLIAAVASDSGGTPVAATQPAATAPAPAAAAPPAPTTVTSEWPVGQDGWTVQVQCLPKDATTPAAAAAAKADATSKGAPDVGVLDSDAFASLDPGQYCVYSGIYDSRSAATAKLDAVKATIPAASVVQVSETAGANDGGGSGASDTSGGSDAGSGAEADKAKAEKKTKKALEQEQKLSPEEFQKQSKKKDKVATEGEAPPADDKAPGAGDEGQTFE